MSARIVITGMGAVTAAGIGVESARSALFEGRSLLGPLTHFASPRCGGFPVAEVKTTNPPGTSRTQSLAALAMREALADARLRPLPSALAERTGIVAGTTVGGMLETEEAIAFILAGRSPDAGVWRRHDCGYLTSSLAAEFDVRGPLTTVSTACSSGALAIGTAAEWIRMGAADVVCAGGADALCRLTLNGFASLLAMDEMGCRPFDRDRRGMSLGEGAAFVVLESERHAERRGRTPIAVLAGWSNSCDAHHATAPDPQGRGIETAMRKALDAAKVAPEDIDYINAHGTGTVDNDRAEGAMLRRVFDRLPPISSTKRVFGHTLAAAGAIEGIACLLAIRHGFVPGNPGFSNADPECGVVPIVRTRLARSRTAVSNSFGFGGNNSILVFTGPEGR